MTETATSAPASAFNPWLSIWIAPRRTIRRILDSEDPLRHVYLLAALAGIGQVLGNASSRALGDEYPLEVIVALAVVVGPFGGIISLYLWGLLISWTGTWLKGQAPPAAIRIALAWASMPLVWGLALYVPEIALFGQELFTTETPLIESSPALLLALLGFIAVELVLAVWALVLIARAVAEAHCFGAWKGLASVLLAGLILLAGVMALVGVVLAATGQFP